MSKIKYTFHYWFSGILIGLQLLMFTGCTNSEALSTIEYNNEIVSILNATSAAIEDSTVIYDKDIPNIVTDQSTINTVELEKQLAEAKDQLSGAKTVMTFKSRNEAQQAQTTNQFENYFELANKYLATYEAMVTYYKENQFKDDLDTVAVYDKDLHNQYNEFIESNNELVDVLNEFVK